MSEVNSMGASKRPDASGPALLVSVVAYGDEQRTRRFLRAFLDAEAPGCPDMAVIVVDTFERYTVEEKRAVRERWGSDCLTVTWIDAEPGSDYPRIDRSPIDGALDAGGCGAGSRAADHQPPVTYIFANDNLGFARGHNLAFDAGGGGGSVPYFLVIANDVDVGAGGTIPRLIGQLEEHPDAGVVGPRVVGGDGRPQGPFRYQSIRARYWTLFVAPLTRLVTGSWFVSDGVSADAPAYVYRLMGCMMLFRGGDFARAGRFDEGTFLYGEESIISERLRAIGKRVLFDPGARVAHEVGSAIGKHYDELAALRLRFASDLYYYARYRNVGAVSRWIARAAVAVFARVYVPALRRIARG
jgi:GT2 family glycosyltransferase